MYESSSFFDQTLHPMKRDKLFKNYGSICSPWVAYTQEQQDSVDLRPKKRKANSNRRYTSQLDSSNYKKKDKSTTIKNQSYLLSDRSVVIEYEAEPQTSKTYQHSYETSKIKLPVLCAKNIGKNSSHTKEASKDKDKWNFLMPNHRKSLKKYLPKQRNQESPPHFQIYKRSLMAARKYMLDTILQPEANQQNP